MCRLLTCRGQHVAANHPAFSVAQKTRSTKNTVRPPRCPFPSYKSFAVGALSITAVFADTTSDRSALRNIGRALSSTVNKAAFPGGLFHCRGNLSYPWDYLLTVTTALTTSPMLVNVSRNASAFCPK